MDRQAAADKHATSMATSNVLARQQATGSRGVYPVAEACPNAQNPRERSSMQVVMRARGCMATARVKAEERDPARQSHHLQRDVKHAGAEGPALQASGSATALTPVGE